jgi:hypothetical protein
MKKINTRILILSVALSAALFIFPENGYPQISKVNQSRSHPSANPTSTEQQTQEKVENPEEPSDSAQRARDVQSQAFSIINSLNPASSNENPGPNDPLAALNDPQFQDTLERLAELQKLLENRWVRGYMQVITHRDVVGGMKKLSSKSPEEYKKLILFQVAFLVLFFIFELWFFGQPMGFLKRIFMKITFLGITIFGVAFIVPTFVLGQDYYKFIWGLIGAIQTVVKAAG